MKSVIFYIVFIIIVLAGKCLCLDDDYGKADQHAINVSLIALIANPEIYQGQLVRVTGVANLEFEGDAIYLSKECHKYGITKNALWIEPDYEVLGVTWDELKELNGQYVLIEGIFDKNITGHFGAYSGAITKITRYASWENVIEFIKSRHKQDTEKE